MGLLNHMAEANEAQVKTLLFFVGGITTIALLCL
jgi:hypothetical protein